MRPWFRSPALATQADRPEMPSCIYTGRLTHTRVSPHHAFGYRTFMLWLDLEDLPRLDRSSPLFGYNRLRPCALWDRDYLEPDAGALAAKVRGHLRRAGCDDEVSRICALTVPRVAHVAFNPLTLFWCLDAAGHTRAIVAEVRNTYRETHVYVLDERDRTSVSGRWARRYRFDKRFFVSPFNGVDGRYDLRVTQPGDRLNVGLDLLVDGRRIIRTSLSLRRRPLDSRTLALTLARYPFSAALTLPRITGQALVLRFAKGLRPRMKPIPTSAMTFSRQGDRRRGGSPAIDAAPRPRVSAARLQRAIAVGTIATPAGATVLALVLAAGGVAVPSGFVLMVTGLFYVLTVLGITIGFHRCFTHRAFQAPDAVRALIGIAGSMAAQGPLLFWVAEHREHHQRSDTPGDPHSPHVSEDGTLRGFRGFWHAHVGWMLQHQSTAWKTYAPDVLRDRAAFFVNRWYPAWVALGLVLPGVAAGLWHGSWRDAALGLLWGGLVRIFLAHQATWSVNSFAHLFGRRPFETPDTSRNNLVVALLTLGEGWHNNHHAFPSSARQGLRRWEVDPSYAGIRLLERIGLARQVKRPDPTHVARRRVPAADALPVVEGRDR